MKEYCLAPGVYVSAAEEGAVFLDLARDDYVGVSSQQAMALSRVVAEWPHETVPAETDDIASDDIHAFADELCHRGLLVTASVARAREGSPPLQLAESELVHWEQMIDCRIRPGHVAIFMLSLVRASMLLRRWPFSRVVARVRERKSRANASRSTRGEALRGLVSAYVHIRAFVFGPKGRCLLDSLTLVEFLAHYDIYPSWVIGVQINPFASHSWVQHGRLVLNGTPSYVRAYEPILVV